MADMKRVVPREGLVVWMMGPRGPFVLSEEGKRVDVSDHHARMLLRDGAIALADAPAQPEDDTSSGEASAASQDQTISGDESPPRKPKRGKAADAEDLSHGD